MKSVITRIVLFAALVAGLVAPTVAQTDATRMETRRLEANAKVCAANAIADPLCTQQAVDAAVAAAAAASPARTLPGGTIYATPAAFKDGVAVKKYLAEEEAKQLNEDASMVVREFVNASKARRTEICAFLNKVC